MISAHIVIHCDSEWLIAGGDSILGTADLAPMLDGEGLPFVPGRTLRGLLREAVAQVDEALGHGANHAARLFGTRKAGPNTREEPGDGCVRIGDALLPREIADLCKKPDDRIDLLATIRRTALNRITRTAKHGTLREMEVAIAGLQLIGTVECRSTEDLELLAFAGGLVRGFGHSRSRGLGRCHLEFMQSGTRIEGKSISECIVGGAR